MARFDSAINLAKTLIAKNGQTTILRNKVHSALPDANQPWNPGGSTSSDINVKAVFLTYDQKYIDGEFIRSGDQKVFIPAYDTANTLVTVNLESLIIRSGEVWKIVSIQPLNPNGQLIMFELQIRQ